MPLPAGTPVVLSPADEAGELAGDNGLASGCGVGLTEAELADVVVGLADLPSIGVFVGVFDAGPVHVL